MTNIADIRKDYMLHALDESLVDKDAIKQFGKWWADAMGSGIDEVNALTLATADLNGKPSARIVLLKGFDDNGFVFFTNYDSHKGKELAINPQASMVFFWKELERQVRIEGIVKKISEAESDAYFNSRPLESRIGAWASPQSTVIQNRDIIEENVIKYMQQFRDKNITRPLHWGGYCLSPQLIEFWQGRPGRLHDRIQFTKKSSEWIIERLAP
jgi:pyridoxamine 5'-phosphate oxidase